VPDSLADACLVRMTELYEPAQVLSLDIDFLLYRRHGRRVIFADQAGLRCGRSRSIRSTRSLMRSN
jgi:hypothetical protein